MANSHATRLNGTNQYWEITNANQTGLNPSSAITLEAFVKIDSTDQTGNIVTRTNEGGGSSYDGYIFELTSGSLKLLMASANDEWTEWTTEVSPVYADDWNHVAVTFDGSDPIFYVNGLAVAHSKTDDAAGVPYSGTTLNQTSAPFRVGVHERDVEGLVNFFKGDIDEVRVWSDVRTASEIANNFESELTGSEAGLEGYWKFNNDGTDETSNGNDLTNKNSATFTSSHAFDGFVEKAIVSAVETATPASPDPTVTKPTGTEENDLLLAFITCFVIDTETAAYAPPSGWTQLQDIGQSNAAPIAVFAKVAGGSEPADYTFTENGAPNDASDSIGSIFLVKAADGFNSASDQTRSAASYGSTYSGVSNSFVNGILFMGFAVEGSNVNFLSYSVANNDPSWNEDIDAVDQGAVAVNLGVAHAFYPDGGDTGNFSSNQDATNTAGALVSLVQVTNAEVTGSTGTITLVGNTGEATGSATVTGSTGTLTIEGNSGTAQEEQKDWTAQDKSSSSWTPKPKS